MRPKILNGIALQKSITKFLLVITLFILGVAQASATTYYAKTSVSPHLTTSWGQISGGTGTAPANFTTAGDIFIIENGTTMTATAVWTIGAAGTTASTLQINSGGSLDMSTFLLTFASCNFTNAGTFTSGTGGITISGTLASNSIAGFTTAGLISMTKTAGTATFTGNVTKTPTTTNGITINGTGGTLSLGVGLTHTILGQIVLTAGTLRGGSSILNVNRVSASAWSGTGSNFIAETGTVNFGATTGNQTIATTTTFYNLTISLSGTLTIGAIATTTTATVNNILSVESTAALAVAGTGTLVYGANATLQYNIGASSRTVSLEWPATFSGTGGVIVKGSGGTITLNAAKNLSGVSLNINAGGILSTSATAANTLTVGGSTTIDGTLTLANTGTHTFTGDVTISGIWNESAAAGLSFGGNLTNNASSFTASSGTHTFTGTSKTLSGSGTTAIPSATFTGTYTNSGTLTSSTLLTVTSPGVLTNNSTITATTALSGTGTLTNGGAGILNINGTASISVLNTSASGNTVNYGGGVQTILNISYYNLALSGSGVKTFPASLAISNDFAISGTASANLGSAAFAHTALTLHLGGSLASSGVYGSTASSAAN